VKYLSERLAIIEREITQLKNENKAIKKKLRQIEQIIDTYHGTMDYSPFERFENE